MHFNLRKVADCVIGVPSYYSDVHRQVPSSNWVAVKELNLSYYIGEAL